MNQIGEFEKVSLAQFEAAMRETYFLKYDLNDLYDDIRLPARATAGSAGYDFFAPFDFTLQPGESIQIPTGIRVRMEPGWFLLGIPKSGLGTKYRLQLDNTAFAIDGLLSLRQRRPYLCEADQRQLGQPSPLHSRRGQVCPGDLPSLRHHLHR